MNYIKHLAGFFSRVASDERLNPTHISMYVSLFQFWNANRFQNPISISRNELMKISKISAKATYHKCMKELNEWQYVKYKPSYNPFKGSLVYLFNLQSGTEQPPYTHHNKNSTGIEQAQEPYTNGSNVINQTLINLDKPAKNVILNNSGGTAKKPKEKSSAKKEMPLALKDTKRKLKSNPQNIVLNDSEGTAAKPVIAKNEAICTIQQVQQYFALKKFPAIEAEKFYNYFQSNGWLVGGRTTMKDWKAAANNWMLNAQKFTSKKISTPTPKNLHTKQNKNYNEPL